MKFTSIVSILLLSTFLSFAQDDQAENKKGNLSGQWRNYYMHSFNEGALQDWYTIATGLKLKYTYDFNEHWQVGGAVYSSWNTGIGNVEVLDPTTGRESRYAAGNFNVQDLSQRFIAYPGELFVQYKAGNHQVKIGRQGFFSPFMNGQDGRMIPTLFEGAFYKYEEKGKLKFQLGAINRIAPRSYNGFENIGQTLGIYPVGRDINGQGSEYRENSISNYVALTNVDYQISPHLKVELWDYYVDNIFNVLYVKPTYNFTDAGLELSAEWLLQNRVGEGGHPDPALRYVQNETAQIFGLQLSHLLTNGKISLGYDHITGQGRFLFPREWGREFLFSFQKRERSEGFGNNHAAVMYYHQNFKFSDQKLKSIFSIGHQWRPSVTEPELNKYAIPNYMHINLDLFYENVKWKGLKPELLITYKYRTGDFPDNPVFILNKVNLFLINAIVNYNF
ncbi:outer membrane porin, OprD family [Marivirga sericea]|uniref:Outer membrane porin, OprD family n=1 Tax=Marivirga sericea TaxID=1028 RepID=A0A1X7L4L4_9BACT|nr:OprD family outer membrane porin [Marivirga sericea]SMG48665.1 outer membrane porin, OprD family [Marivirga sericea]